MPVRPWLAAIAAFALSACAMHDIAPPQASLDNIQLVRAAGVPLMTVGPFTPAPGRPTQMDRTITIRGGVDAAPEGSFARYLGDTLQSQLAAAGRYDRSSRLVVSGMVTDSQLTSLSAGSAKLAARFTLTSDGRVVFDKTLAVEDAWDTDFFADVAVPDAINHYAGLFPRLAAKLFSDPDFLAAAKAASR